MLGLPVLDPVLSSCCCPRMSCFRRLLAVLGPDVKIGWFVFVAWSCQLIVLSIQKLVAMCQLVIDARATSCQFDVLY